MSNWQKVKLGKVVDNFDSQRIPIRANKRIKGKYPYYGASGIVDYVNDYIFDGEYLLVSEDGENLNSRKAPIAFMAKGKFWVNNHAHILRGKKDILNSEFLCYQLQTTNISGYITGAAQPKLSQNNLNEILINYPPFLIQKRIASILSALDDKIENNRRICDKLDNQVEEIFNKWFIIEAENSWKTKHIEELIELNRGISYSSKTLSDITNGIPMHSLSSIDVKGSYNYDGIKYYKGEIKERHWLKPGDLLIINTDLTQNNRIIGWPIFIPDIFKESVSTHHLYTVKIIDKEISKLFLYYLFRNKRYRNQLVQAANGTTVSMLSKSAINKCTVILPPQKMRDKFENYANRVLDLKTNLQKEITNITTIRDTLLPKLMSGEVEV